MRVRPRFNPASRAKRVRTLLASARWLDPMVYRGTVTGVRRHEPKRDRTVSARQWKRARKEARHVG